MKTVELQRFGSDGLVLVERPAPRPGPGEVLVRVLAVSLNYRDIEILEGRYGMPVSLPLVPTSDAVGEVVELGDGVKQFALGEHVNTVFLPDWQEGEFRGEYFRHQLGSSVRGVLQEFIVAREAALVHAPRHLGPEAATLPIAALTAWNSLREAAVIPGQTVLVIGTGGVSLFALQLARAFGAKTIAVTGSSRKGERLKQCNADEVIYSASVPEWGECVRSLTGGRGRADVILEVGGGETLAQSTIALKVGGFIAVVGYLGSSQATLDVRALFIGKRARLHGQTVGSRAHLEELIRAIEAHEVRPVIDSSFPVTRAAEAYQRARSREAFGKVLITL